MSSSQGWLDERSFAEAQAMAERIEGWLLPSEVRFLLLVAAQPTTRGAVVELGAFHGKSTAILAQGTLRTKSPGLVSVDPYDAPERDAHLHREGLASLVDFRAQTSTDFWHDWTGEIRLLWHDGANDCATVVEDIHLALPHLADGAIVAFHDVRNPSGERLHAYCNEVLTSPHFGASGVCGTIGWSQYHADANEARPHHAANECLRRQLARLGPYHDLNRKSPMKRLEKMRYKLLRWFVPHGEMTPRRWQQLSKRHAPQLEVPVGCV